MFNPEEIKKDFPIFSAPENEGIIYFDNAATTQRPLCVIDAISDFYKKNNANPLRGLYGLSVRATDAYENARQRFADFINAESSQEIIFTRNTSESINLIAYTYGMAQCKEGDEIVISCMEHHSNILPWQMVCKTTGAKLVWLECDEEGVISREEYQSKIGEKTKILSIAHVSNVFGITNPVKEMAAYAHEKGNGGKGACVVVDGAQSLPHLKVDVRDINADFYAVSGHKVLGPMGIGALYAKLSFLNQMEPFLRGGEMIEYVTRDSATYAELPHKFEAGTVNAADAVGFAAALDYVSKLGFDEIKAHDDELAGLLYEGMSQYPYVHIIGNKDARRHSGIITFTIDGVHPHDIASILDTEKIAVRAGHHCAQPLMQKLNVGSTARASLYIYNSRKEVEAFVEKISHVREWMGIKD